MTLDKFLALGQTAMELGLVNALTVLSLFLSYSMLNVCDLSTDGCFTLGAATGALVAIAGFPWLSLPAAMLAGMVSGFVTAYLPVALPACRSLPEIDSFQDSVFTIFLLDLQHCFLQLVFLLQILLFTFLRSIIREEIHLFINRFFCPFF